MISRFDGILDLRPPELVLAIDNIVPGYSAISGFISHFRCQECGVSAPFLEEMGHPSTCLTGKVLNRYRKAMPLHASHDAREILKQWHECEDPTNWHTRGAYYVQFDRGTFTMHPFGESADWRYHFEVRRESYIPQAPWIFVVMA